MMTNWSSHFKRMRFTPDNNIYTGHIRRLDYFSLRDILIGIYSGDISVRLRYEVNFSQMIICTQRTLYANCNCRGSGVKAMSSLFLHIFSTQMQGLKIFHLMCANLGQISALLKTAWFEKQNHHCHHQRPHRFQKKSPKRKKKHAQMKI